MLGPRFKLKYDWLELALCYRPQELIHSSTLASNYLKVNYVCHLYIRVEISVFYYGEDD